MAENNGRVYSVKDVAKMCRVSNETIRRWIRKHGLHAYNTTGGLAIKIVEDDLRQFAGKFLVGVPAADARLPDYFAVGAAEDHVFVELGERRFHRLEAFSKKIMRRKDGNASSPAPSR